MPAPHTLDAGHARAREEAGPLSLAEPSLAGRDVLALPVVLLAGMPRPTTLELRVTWRARDPDGTPVPSHPVVFTTSQAAHREATSQGVAAWAPAEYSALALAVELGRVRPPATSGPLEGVSPEFASWCVAKRDRGLVVTERIALGGAEGLAAHHDVRVRGARGWSWQPQLVARAARPAGVVAAARDGRASGGASGTGTASTLTFGELLEHLGAELVSVVVHERPRAVEVSAEALAAM